MRLLQYKDKGEFSLTESFGDETPQYAILSHTWGAEEVTFKDLMDGTGKGKDGYRKIQFCGKQARRDGLQYFWVDTCCIDKSSSAELAEAINSMFQWYKKAAKCYVYLADISVPDYDERQSTWEPNFRSSRWFTRGWTLQELIAPASVEFFSSNNKRLGDRISLIQQICEITGIPSRALQGASLGTFSVDERLSWAAKRQTTRKEDKAYCLLGIFSIYLPLIYGEGDNAFSRLKAEIFATAPTGNILPASKIPITDGPMREQDRTKNRVSGILYISPPLIFFNAKNGCYIGEAGKVGVYSHPIPFEDALGPVPVVEPVGGCKTMVRCNAAPPVRLASGQELRFRSDAELEGIVRVSGILHIVPPLIFFNANNGYYIGEAGKVGVYSHRIPFEDALGPVPVVEPVGGCKTMVRCNAAPPIHLVSGQELRFEADKD